MQTTTITRTITPQTAPSVTAKLSKDKMEHTNYLARSIKPHLQFVPIISDVDGWLYIKLSHTFRSDKEIAL